LNGEDFDGASTLRLGSDGGKGGLGVFANPLMPPNGPPIS